MIGMIGIMDEEIISIKRKMQVNQRIQIAGMQYYIGLIDDKEVIAVKCHQGKAGAAICTQILIDQFNVEYIINVGVAAGLNPDLNIGDWVIASDGMKVDSETLFDDKEIASNEFKTENYIQMNEKLISVAEAGVKLLKGNQNVFIGCISSEDEFICSMRVEKHIYTPHTAYCAEMEGTSIAHTCFWNQIPFVMVRIISDKADQNPDMNFEDFVDESARNISRVIESVVRNI